MFCGYKWEVHQTLLWLENNVRKPLDGTALDILVARPLKDLYLSRRKQH